MQYIHRAVYLRKYGKSFMTKKIFDLKGFRGNRMLGQVNQYILRENSASIYIYP